MEIFWKTVGLAMVALVLSISVEQYDKNFALMITLAAASMVGINAMMYLEPAMDFLNRITYEHFLETEGLRTMIRGSGVAVTAQFASTLCKDAGKASLGKCMDLLSACAIVYLSLPFYKELLDNVQYLLENL